MREIKFRFWDGEEMRFAEIREISWGILSGVSDINCPGFSGGIDIKNIMQYTGLKDKNGEEIYEGDIYRADSWSGSRYVKWNNESTGFEPFVYWESPINSDEIEIIGNMYENPELLHNNI